MRKTILATIVMLAAACGGSSGSKSNGAGGPGAPAEAAASVGAKGGAVEAGGSKVTIPAGALPGDVKVSVRELTAFEEIPGIVQLGKAMLFEPQGVEFKAPVEIVMEIDPAKLPEKKKPEDVEIYGALIGSTNYRALKTEIVDATHVKTSTTHFLIFVPGVFNPPEAPSGANPGATPTEPAQPTLPPDGGASSGGTGTGSGGGTGGGGTGSSGGAGSSG